LGFRPQPDVEKNVVIVNRNTDNYANDRFVKSLNQYLQVCKYQWRIFPKNEFLFFVIRLLEK